MISLLCGSFAAPAASWASGSGGSGSGGSGLGSGSGTTTPTGTTTGAGTTTGTGTTTPTVTPQAGNVTVSAAGSGITVQSRASAILRRGLSFSGTAPSNAAGETVEIQRSGHQTLWRWANTVHATIGSDGTFTATWQTNHIGRFAIRAIIVSSSQAQATSQAQPATVTPAMTVTVYRPSLATQYGPGFYGHKTACGQQLTRGMIGVANRTLRCGEKVALYYNGQTLIVPVIDRGPYANGADWDLTEATGQVLGIAGTATIGAVSLPNR